jgi:RNA polymerase sigma-70 factor (ECF subfamily)
VRDFATTHWSVVLQAQDPQTHQAIDALGKLCRAYWYPLYAFVRRQGYTPEEAQDLTQEFFSRLSEKNALKTVAREKGRFRSYLLMSMKHLLANEWNRSQCQKRGGGFTFLSLDELHAEERYRLEPVDELTPEKAYERRWAEAIIDSVTLKLRDEFVAAGQVERFEALKIFLLVGQEPVTYAAMAGSLGMTEGAVRTAIHRMRQRYGALFRAEIAQTVTSLSEMEDEIRHFLEVLAS